MGLLKYILPHRTEKILNIVQQYTKLGSIQDEPPQFARPGAVNHTSATQSWVNPILATPRKIYNTFILYNYFIQYKKFI